MKESTDNSLYNFKGKKKYFLEVIEEFQFTPRYNKEFILLDNNSDRPAIEIITPMVCWCDIPLKRIKNHTSRYGEYGIGISKEWAIKNWINPIIYVIEDTIIAKAFSEVKDMQIALQEIMDGDEQMKKKIARITERLFYANNLITQHIKPYSYQRIPSKHENRKFYDEKEWRYVPDPIHPFENLTIFPFLYKDEGEMNQAVLEANEKIKNRYLSFGPDDIRIILIKDKEEKKEIIESLKKACEQKGYADKLDILIGKVKTLKELE